MRLVLILWCAVWCAGVCAQAAELQVQPEYLRTAPDGEVVAADHAAGGHARPSSLAGARAGYVSLQVIAKLHAAAEYSLELTPIAGLHVDVFRECITRSKGTKLFFRMR